MDTRRAPQITRERFQARARHGDRARGAGRVAVRWLVRSRCHPHGAPGGRRDRHRRVRGDRRDREATDTDALVVRAGDRPRERDAHAHAHAHGGSEHVQAERCPSDAAPDATAALAMDAERFPAGLDFLRGGHLGCQRQDPGSDPSVRSRRGPRVVVHRQAGGDGWVGAASGTARDRRLLCRDHHRRSPLVLRPGWRHHRGRHHVAAHQHRRRHDVGLAWHLRRPAAVRRGDHPGSNRRFLGDGHRTFSR